MLLMNGLVGDFTFAARLAERAELLSTLFYLPPNPNVVYSAALMSKVEQIFLTGKPPYPVERTLLTTGLVAAGMQSLANGQRRLETPHLAIRYRAPRESSFLERLMQRQTLVAKKLRLRALLLSQNGPYLDRGGYEAGRMKHSTSAWSGTGRTCACWPGCTSMLAFRGSWMHPISYSRRSWKLIVRCSSSRRRRAELAGWLRQILAHQLAHAQRELGRAKRDIRRERSLAAELDVSSQRLGSWLAAEQSSPANGHSARAGRARRRCAGDAARSTARSARAALLARVDAATASPSICSARRQPLPACCSAA